MRHDHKMDRNCRVVMTVAKMSAPNSLMSIRIKICATEKKKRPLTGRVTQILESQRPSILTI